MLQIIYVDFPVELKDVKIIKNKNTYIVNSCSSDISNIQQIPSLSECQHYQK